MLLSLEVLTGARLPPDTTLRCQKSTVYSTKRISGLSHEPHRFAVQLGCDTCPTEDRQHGKSSLTKDGIFCRRGVLADLSGISLLMISLLC
jgi:hypothetical protein